MIKKYLLVSFMCIICLSSTFGQVKTTFGVKAGLCIPDLSSGSANPISSGYSSRLDADVAVQAEVRLSDYFSFQPQLEFSSQGGRKKGLQAFTTPDEFAPLFPPGHVPTYLYADYKSEAKLNYLMLPMLSKIRFGTPLQQWRFYIAAGPFISYLLNAKNITSGSSMIYADKGKTQPLTPGPQSFDAKENVTSDLHRFNTGISGHVGIERRLGNSYLFAEAGGNYGLLNIQKHKEDGTNRTGAAVVSIGYQFPYKQSKWK